MASSREIKRRIRSVKNVGQITRAMEMVAASKMRRAQRNVMATRPYADSMRNLIGELSNRSIGMGRKGTMLEVKPDTGKVALIVVTPDRGLAGSLSSNIFRRVGRFIIEQQQLGRTVDTYAYGKKGRDFLARTGQNLQAEAIKLGDAPKLEQILGVATAALSRVQTGEYCEVYLIYSEFVNTLVQRPNLKKLVPVEAPESSGGSRLDFTYEPSQEEILSELLPRYVETQIYQAILESIASFYSAQMVAMRNATKSAKDLVRDLTLSFNKARQAAITKEVSEISSGAAALADG
ncbi:F0F1 ATP synthase subunit gamma [Candidatus Viridilinea mediisalina]|uniref:ATP synthase gamma chain n=1 Tax=Candidatus Viridilinea mediisalina TaxID=2024553 RepID=A0A2A6RKQ0_9CHLR|nr:F0F1 ATP synthase subunit gamma [Candidatus Viridilinea mediisalina]PDW03459.1 ATP synthase F1 subunit gamma [Candidatus Viridilinea mediisalina]